MQLTASALPAPARPTPKPAEPTRKPAPGQSAVDVWERLEAAKTHPYATRKKLCDEAMQRLRIVGENDPLTYYRGWLAVPGYSIDGVLQTIEFVSPEAGANKMTLKGSQKSGAMFSVGSDTGPIVVVEGLATASAVFGSTGALLAARFAQPIGYFLQARLKGGAKTFAHGLLLGLPALRVAMQLHLQTIGTEHLLKAHCLAPHGMGCHRLLGIKRTHPATAHH